MNTLLRKKRAFTCWFSLLHLVKTKLPMYAIITQPPYPHRNVGGFRKCSARNLKLSEVCNDNRIYLHFVAAALSEGPALHIDASWHWYADITSWHWYADVASWHWYADVASWHWYADVASWHWYTYVESWRRKLTLVRWRIKHVHTSWHRYADVASMCIPSSHLCMPILKHIQYM